VCSRHEAIELSRLCAARPDLSRVTLHMWRAFVFPAPCQECGFVLAVSYQDAAIHAGTPHRSGIDPRSGRKGRRKVVWGLRDGASERRRRRAIGLVASSDLGAVHRHDVRDFAHGALISP
jgi:hypothetical protein